MVNALRNSIIVSALVGALAFSTCAYAADANAPPKLSDKQVILAAQKAVIDTLKDPDSAKFSSLYRATKPDENGKPTDVVCGFVNARNSFGGYIGKSVFAYVIDTNTAYVSEPDVTMYEDAHAANISATAYVFCLSGDEQKAAMRAALGL